MKVNVGNVASFIFVNITEMQRIYSMVNVWDVDV